MSAPLVAPTRRIFELTLGELLARRTAFVAIAAGAPVLLAIVARLALASGTATFVVNGNRLDTESMFGTVVSVLYLRFVVPALGLFYGTSLIADEVEEKTITYLFVRPIASVLPGYLSQFTIAHYVQATPSGAASLLVVPIAALAAAMRIVEQREYVLEQ